MTDDQKKDKKKGLGVGKKFTLKDEFGNDVKIKVTAQGLFEGA